MQSATCALAANPNDERRAASGRRHPERTRNPTLPAIGVVPPIHSDAKIAMQLEIFIQTRKSPYRRKYGTRLSGWKKPSWLSNVSLLQG
jgi:hypothetical protein